MLLVEVLENPNEYYGQPSVGPKSSTEACGRRRKLFRRLSSADVALDSEAALHSYFAGQQEDTDQTRTQSEHSASRHTRGTLTQGRGNQQERSVYLLMAGGLRPTENTDRDRSAAHKVLLCLHAPAGRNRIDC